MTSTYAGEPGAPSDPATPGPYCLARCYCGTCPQYAQQRAASQLLRDQEYGQRAARYAAAMEKREQARKHGWTPREDAA